MLHLSTLHLFHDVLRLAHHLHVRLPTARDAVETVIAEPSEAVLRRALVGPRALRCEFARVPEQLRADAYSRELFPRCVGLHNSRERSRSERVPWRLSLSRFCLCSQNTRVSTGFALDRQPLSGVASVATTANPIGLVVMFILRRKILRATREQEVPMRKRSLEMRSDDSREYSRELLACSIGCCGRSSLCCPYLPGSNRPIVGPHRSDDRAHLRHSRLPALLLSSHAHPRPRSDKVHVCSGTKNPFSESRQKCF